MWMLDRVEMPMRKVNHEKGFCDTIGISQMKEGKDYELQ